MTVLIVPWLVCFMYYQLLVGHPEAQSKSARSDWLHNVSADSSKYQISAELLLLHDHSITPSCQLWRRIWTILRLEQREEANRDSNYMRNP